ncbi:hypothetical protein ACLOJK_018002 [Asimina triloba]
MDYYSYYPTVLPLRRPHSGNPGMFWRHFSIHIFYSKVLNEQEFEEASANAYGESGMNSAEGLGLTTEEKHPEILFFQLPASLPMVKRPASAKSKETEVGRKASAGPSSSKEGCRLEELPAGFMGKILVYKSGAVKMKLGDTLFDHTIGKSMVGTPGRLIIANANANANDCGGVARHPHFPLSRLCAVSPGEKCVFAQDVAAINPVDKHCCILGEINKHAIVTPDVDSLLNGIANLE